MAGPVPPDGRPPQPPGVGKTARRHDLEKPATPGLQDRGMQYGDAQRFQQGLRKVPISGTRPVSGQGRAAIQPQNKSGKPMSNMFRNFDPLQKIMKQASGTLHGAPEATPPGPNSNQYLEFVRRVATQPGASSPLVHAFVRAAHHHAQEGTPLPGHINLTAMDNFLAEEHGIE